MRIFLDANILFSAAKSAGAVRRFLIQLKTSGHTLVADGYVAGEARRNIETKFPKAVGDLEDLLAGWEIYSETCVPLAEEILTDLPEKNRPVLAAAIQHRCDVLLTGDKTHFGSLYGRCIKGVTVHSPAILAKTIEASPDSLLG